MDMPKSETPEQNNSNFTLDRLFLSIQHINATQESHYSILTLLTSPIVLNNWSESTNHIMPTISGVKGNKISATPVDFQSPNKIK